ncbi:MAG: FHA domain-containing protein [Planctomycetes bacterium]|nr:FHA domain-containing protein [Planctomycetota bacterium]
MVGLRIVLRRIEPAEELRQQVFRLQPGGVVTFGRSADNDFEVADPERKVSSRHGRIECMADGSLRAFDLGSLNGTLHDGVPIDAGQGLVLAPADRLQVGDFELLLSLEPDPVAQGVDLDATLSTADPARRAEQVLQQLATRHAELLASPAPVRAATLAVELRQGLADLPPETAAAVLRLCGKKLGGVGGKAAGAKRGGAEGGATEDAEAGALAALQALAAPLVPGQTLRSAADAQLFANLVRQYCDASVQWLGQSLQSRSLFAKEFGAEVTLVFQRTENPLKGLEAKELAQYLFDWSGPAGEHVRRHYLEAVLHDLAEHQLAVLASVREAVGQVVAQLAPARILAASQSERSWSLASRAARAWEAYEKLYAELFEERGKLFQQVISPAIQQGYLRQHERPAEGAEPQSEDSR